MGHVIYNLAKNPDIQEKLYQELRAEVTPGQHVKPGSPGRWTEVPESCAARNTEVFCCAF